MERLWEDFGLPIKDALHYADGHSYDVALDPAAPRGFTVLDRLAADMPQAKRQAIEGRGTCPTSRTRASTSPR